MLRRALYVALGAAVVVAAVLWWPRAQVVPFAGVMHDRGLGADFFFIDAKEIVYRGSSRVFVVRFNKPPEFVPHHFRNEGLTGPLTVDAWQKRVGAPIVFNAGQFDEDLNHLGWLRADGKWLSKTRKDAWKALLVSGAEQGGAFAGIVDLAQANPDVASNYRHVVQSMMLIDEGSRVRVRESDRSACRTAVAEDRQGRMLIIVTEGAVRLAEFARWLARSGLEVRRAMNLDGGLEAQVAVRTRKFKWTFLGQHGTGTTMFQGGAGDLRYPIPAVIAVRPAQ